MKQYTYITNHKSLLGDLHTPVSTYLKVRDLFPQSVLMESSDYHGVENNRSFIGLNPIASIRINHGVATFVFPDGQQEERNISDDYQVEQAIREFISHFQVEGEYAGYCGLYGYTTFNAVRYFEKIQVKDSTDAKNDAPEILYILYKYLIVFNDYKSEMVLIEMLGEGEPAHLSEVEKAIHNRNYHLRLPCRRSCYQHTDRRRAQGQHPAGHCSLHAGRCFPDCIITPLYPAIRRR